MSEITQVGAPGPGQVWRWNRPKARGGPDVTVLSVDEAGGFAVVQNARGNTREVELLLFGSDAHGGLHPAPPAQDPPRPNGDGAPEGHGSDLVGGADEVGTLRTLAEMDLRRGSETTPITPQDLLDLTSRVLNLREELIKRDTTIVGLEELLGGFRAGPTMPTPAAAECAAIKEGLELLGAENKKLAKRAEALGHKRMAAELLVEVGRITTLAKRFDEQGSLPLDTPIEAQIKDEEATAKKKNARGRGGRRPRRKQPV